MIDLVHLSIHMTGSPGEILSRFLHEYPRLYYSLQHMQGIKSQVGLHQACGLMLMAEQFDRKTCSVLNIGCAFGYSTACLSRGAPLARIVSLDVDLKRIQIAQRALSNYRNVQLIRMKSWDYFDDQRWDMIFVDGCHRAIWRDMPFYNRVKPGGLFLSHDYIPARFPFVVEALNGLEEQFDRPFDVRIYDDRGCGVVGMVRQKEEIWQMPKDYVWTKEKVKEWARKH